jgi:hypothetical protein
MVPASLRIKRAEPKPKHVKPRGPDVGPGFGLAPVPKPASLMGCSSSSNGLPSSNANQGSSAAPLSTDSKYMEFMQTLNDLGAFE